ncbi:MAG: hypothetical protein IH614_02895, partial [Desulfuromonadales bacterium]|nr:hypothetical protein [Desulfuromonadales bacterium]
TICSPPTVRRSSQPSSPPERVFKVSGNHTIATFKTIFMRHLDTLTNHTPPFVGP